jgi:hypothetical protein
MTIWLNRSREEKALLNPAFCSNLLWHAALGHFKEGNSGLSFEEAFLVLPIILHEKTRNHLPRTAQTSLAVWLAENQLQRSSIILRAKSLVKHTKEALMFGGRYGLLRIEQGVIYAETNKSRIIIKTLSKSSEEVRTCAKKAQFLGKWFDKAGNSSTVLAMIGVRP